MKSSLKNLSEIIAKANDVFYSRNSNIDTIMGIMDKTLRNQGMNADAITIDCIAQEKKMVILIHDDKPNVANITLGNKNGDIDSSSEYLISEITEAVIVEIMEMNFIL